MSGLTRARAQRALKRLRQGIVQARQVAPRKNTRLLQPGLKFRRRLESEHAAHVEGIVKRGGLIIQHDVVGSRDAHDERTSGDGEQRQRHVHVVLIGLGMVRVADVAAHRETEQLAAEVILEAGADDLLAVVEVLGPDEPDHRVDEQRPELARHRIGPCLAGLLVHAMVGVGGQGIALSGFEVHHVVAQRAALERERRLVRLLEQGKIDAEARVGGLRPGDRLEDEIHRRAASDRLHRVRHVRSAQDWVGMA